MKWAESRESVCQRALVRRSAPLPIRIMKIGISGKLTARIRVASRSRESVQARIAGGAIAASGDLGQVLGEVALERVGALHRGRGELTAALRGERPGAIAKQLADQPSPQVAHHPGRARACRRPRTRRRRRRGRRRGRRARAASGVTAARSAPPRNASVITLGEQRRLGDDDRDLERPEGDREREVQAGRSARAAEAALRLAGRRPRGWREAHRTPRRGRLRSSRSSGVRTSPKSSAPMR